MKAIATLFAGLFAVSVFAADAPKKEEKKAEAKPAAAAPATPAPAPKAEAKKDEKKEAAKKWIVPRAYVKTFKKPSDFDDDKEIELDIHLARNLKRIQVEEEEEDVEISKDIKNKLKLFRTLALLKYDEMSSNSRYF